MVINRIFIDKLESIAGLVLNSTREFGNFLGIETALKVTSVEGYEKARDRLKNLINIRGKEVMYQYINPKGGVGLYSKEGFAAHGTKLSFIQGSQSLSIVEISMK